MKNRIQLIMVLILFAIVTKAQQQTTPAEVCDDINMTTDPQSPVDLREQPFLNYDTQTGLAKFDWTTDFFEWFKLNKPFPSYPVESPFYTFNNSVNIEHLIDNDQIAPDLRDNKVADGWELITYEFGKNIFGTVGTGPDHPMFVLYNKFTGVLRVFVYFRESNFEEDYDIVTLRLSWEKKEENNYQSANFNHFQEVTRSLNNFQFDQNENVANQVTAGVEDDSESSGFWLHADFTMAYDPCVCNYRYNKFLIEIEGINEAQLTLTGDLSTKPIDKQAGNNGSVNTNASYLQGLRR